MKWDMSKKVCLVTGANSGIGKATAEGLAGMGATVVMLCRDRGRGESAREDVARKTGSGTVDLIIADLGSLKAVRDAAEAFKAHYDRLDVLINNAAIVPRKREVTADGFEAQFGVNHLAPFLLTNLLRDVLTRSAPSRVVNVASTVHHGATLDFNDMQSEKGYSAIRVYGRTKLANVLFTYELARRLEGTGVTANCLHPGVVRTNILRDLPGPLRAAAKAASLFFLGPEKGAQTTLYLAASPDVEGVTGKYFDQGKEAKSSPASYDREAAARLWEISARLAGLG